MKTTISISKSIDVDEWCTLMSSVGFGKKSDYFSDKVLQSISSYPFIAHAHAADGKLIGYVSAFSDRAFSTFIGEIVVHPLFQKQGIGKQLLTAVETYSAGVPIYVNPLRNSEQFFIHQGFKPSADKIPTLFKV